MAGYQQEKEKSLMKRVYHKIGDAASSVNEFVEWHYKGAVATIVVLGFGGFAAVEYWGPRGKNIFIDIDQSFSPTTIQGKQYVVVNDHEEREMKPSNIALFEVDTLGGKVTYRPITWDEVKNTPGHGDILEQIEKAKKTSLEGKVQEH